VTPGETGEVIWAWLPALSAGVAAVLAAGALGTVALAGWRLAGHRRLISAGLRIAALLPLVLALAGLSLATIDRTTVRRSVVVVLDGSASMGIRDGASPRVERMAAYLERARPRLDRLAGQADLQLWWAGSDPRPLAQDTLGSLPPPTGTGTDYLTLLEERIAEQHPAAVVLLGDGADRAALGQAFAGAGEEGVAAALADLAVPVSTVTFGGDVEGDLAVRIGEMAPFAFVRRPVTVPVSVDAEPGTAAEVTVTLSREGARVGARTVALGEDGHGEVTFELTPEQVGYLTLDVAAPTPDSDPLPGNNADAVTLRVIRDRTRILQLASHPSWDVRYLRRFLKTDPNIDLISFYILREAPLWGPYRNSPISLIEFPHRELFSEDLAGFDLVILQNFSFESLPGLFGARADYLHNLIEFVRDGGALLLVGGDRSFGRADAGALADVLPIELGPAGEVGSGSGPLELTDAGVRHPVMRLAGGSEANRRAWEALGSPGSYNDVGPARDAAVVLATAGPDGDPVLAVQQLGTGRLLTLASDGTWRWALEGEGHAHTRFWHNAVRWLVRDEESGLLEVRPHAENVLPGESIRVACRAITDDYAGRPDAPLSLSVTSLDGEPVGEALAGTTDADGGWIGEVPAPAPGTYRLVLTSSELPDEEAVARFTVRADQPELADPAGRPELMAALAERTGGQVLDPDGDLADLSLEGLVEREVTRRVAAPAWDRPWWLLLAVVPLGLEWFLRRRWGA